MKKIIYSMGIILIGIILFGIYAFTNEESKNMSIDNNSVKQERIDLHFGHQGVEDFIAQQSREDQHPVGMGFMDLYWRSPNLGKVRIVTDHSDLEIDHVFKAGGIALNQGSDDGIQDITIQSSLHEEEYITQRGAYNAYVALMTQLNEKGWQQHFLPYVAPIDKRDNLKYLADRGRIIDPTYLLNYEEWQERNSIIFNLYHDEIQLSIMLNRRFQDKETDRVQYMMRYSFETQRYFARNMITDSHKMNAEELEAAFKQKQIDYKRYRQSDMLRMQEEGYRIDENYVDHEIWQYAR